MRRVILTVEDDLPNGKHIATSESFLLYANNGPYLAVAIALAINRASQALDNRQWIQGTGPVHYFPSREVPACVYGDRSCNCNAWGWTP